tara:strand:- start:4430 stop:4894 length:465 start_codon:yes stop_codon:yes gene_type:complete
MFKWLWRTPAKRLVNKVIVHCSATPPTMDIGVKEMRQWHTSPPNNWSDIGYHLVIRRDGEIEDGRDIERTGAHTRGKNKGSIGICMVGGVDSNMEAEDNFTEKQWRSLRALLLICHADYKKATIHGHNEFAAKACPSFDVQHELKNGRLSGIVK